MVDCYMSLNVTYAIELAQKCIDEGVNINWWEECLHPDDFDGHRKVDLALFPYFLLSQSFYSSKLPCHNSNGPQANMNTAVTDSANSSKSDP